MSNINPQYTFDSIGNPVGVFLPIEDWNTITEKLHLDLSQWQKDLIQDRLTQYKNNPSDILDWDVLTTQFSKEDEAVIKSV